jgi:hypothetical protein
LKKREEEKTAKSEKNLSIHENVICDGCNINPIVGPCYKCSVCFDFDYCEKCQSHKKHEHSFLKIINPNLRPKFIIATNKSKAAKEIREQIEERQENYFQ